MAEPCVVERHDGAEKVVLGWRSYMLGTEGGAGKNWSKKGGQQPTPQTFAEAEPQKLGLDGGAVRVGKTWRPQKLGLDGGAVRVGKT